MPRDYKHSGASQRRKKSHEGNTGWVWLIVGFALGFATAMAVTWLQQSENELPRLDLEPAEGETRGDTEDEEDERGRFNFYRMLESFEVVVPEEEVRVRESDREQEQPVEEGRYILQVGSFRSESDAERMRANLGLAGFESRIQRVSIDDGQTYYRVRVGPIENPTELERTRERLEDQGIEPLLIRLRED
ncbi:hypothetical protein J2T60_002066 [Natronospira proteinivora]|uniref:SPOR domain-containing protein n=1 Tax=Natronospira proteinivora TaxID=1807133 RepID=A0ABT1G9R4_9GAMM|nr:SPOR domain-containing protein [Natronospira proteinivora]MCP1728066.1 hypothetical protein [Natronospira proteinivora]